MTKKAESDITAQPQTRSWRHTKEAQTLLRRIQDNDSTLTSVNLQHKGLDSGDTGVLAAALKNNRNIQELFLFRNEVGDDGVVALAGVLQANSTLELLDLGGNRIQDRGAKALAHMVRYNSHIKYLYLGGNCIEDGGARALAMALIHSSTLKGLGLGLNSISDGGAEALACAICLNPFLNYLDLEKNRIGERGTGAIDTAMRNLGGEGVGHENMAAFAEGLFVETSPIQLGPEELGAIKQHLAVENADKEEFTLGSGLGEVRRRDLMGAVVGYGMVQAAVSETEDHAVLMIAVRAGMANGIRSIFEITRANQSLFKLA